MLPLPVALIFRYFNFIAFSMSLLNLWATREKVTTKGKVFMALFSGLWLIWGVLQLIGGYNSFFFVLLSPIEHPLVIVFWVIYFAFLWGTTGWVLLGNGADELLQSDILLFRNVIATPQTIKAIFLVLSILLPLLLMVGHVLGIFSDLTKNLAELFA